MLRFPNIPSRWILTVLNILALVYYFAMFNAIGSLSNTDRLMFSMPDAMEYRGQGEWLLGNADYCNPNRPFLYPLLVLISASIAGTGGVWIMQIIFWLVACNLAYLAVRKMSAPKIAASFAFLLIATYTSAICLTGYALTEITVLLLLSWITYLFSAHQVNFRSLRFGLLALLAFSMLFAIKPFYKVLLIPAVLVFLAAHYRSFLKPMTILLMLGALSPAIIQYGINLATSGKLHTDVLASYNLKHYLVNKVDYFVEHKDTYQFNYLGDSTYKVRGSRMARMSVGDAVNYLSDHPSAAAFVFYENLKLNIADGNTYIDPVVHPDLTQHVWKTNNRFWRWHHNFFYGIAAFFILTAFKRKTSFHFWLLSLCIISYSVLVVTGITFWAGDRLVVPAIGVWAVVYTVCFHRAAKFVWEQGQAWYKKRKNSRQARA